MKKTILNIGKALNRSEQQQVTGGQGPYKVKCNSGVWIDEVPNLNSSTTAWACSNQGGFQGSWQCVGGGCTGIQ